MNSERLLWRYLSSILSGNEYKKKKIEAVYTANSNLSVSLDGEQIVKVTLEVDLVRKKCTQGSTIFSVSYLPVFLIIFPSMLKYITTLNVQNIPRTHDFLYQYNYQDLQ